MPILMYHRVADDGPDSLVRWRVPPPEFARQMAWLAEAGYATIRLEAWQEAERQGPDVLRRRVCLTFDDAYADLLDAMPVLQRHGFGATMFVPTGFMGGAADWDASFGPPAPLMRWDDLDALFREGIEIGAHTVTHPRLTEVEDDAAMAGEITVSRDVLAQRYGAIPTFAYPYGDYDARVEKAVADAGFVEAVTIDPDDAGPLARGRVSVFGDEPFATFVEKVTAASR